MKLPYRLWLHLAAKIMPLENELWLEAMSAECQEIADPVERHAFAAGCLKTASIEFARSRKGLNYMARGFGATALTAGSSVLPTEFLNALNIETAALMGSLLFAATYLGWLYTPNHNEL